MIRACKCNKCGTIQLSQAIKTFQCKTCGAKRRPEMLITYKTFNDWDGEEATEFVKKLKEAKSEPNRPNDHPQ